MKAQTCTVRSHVRRLPPPTRAYLDKHAELRREVDELRIDALGELLADALMLSLIDEECF